MCKTIHRGVFIRLRDAVPGRAVWLMFYQKALPSDLSTMLRNLEDWNSKWFVLEVIAKPFPRIYWKAQAIENEKLLGQNH